MKHPRVCRECEFWVVIEEDDGYCHRPVPRAATGCRESRITPIWKVVKGDSDVNPWTYFDFMRLEDGVTFETVWGNADLTKFAAGWTGLWGREPDATDMAVNYQVHMTNLSKPGNLDTAQLIAVVLSPDPAALPTDAALFTVEKHILGKAVSGQIAVVGLELAKGAYSPSWGKQIIIAECVASPNGRTARRI